MDPQIGETKMPINFKYKDIFLRGKPMHDKYDAFSIRHPKMSAAHRAKIFSPFDALKGFSEAVSAKTVLYQENNELGPEEQEELDKKVKILQWYTRNSRVAKENHVVVRVTYYIPCTDINHELYKKQGTFQDVVGICMGIDPTVTRTIRIGETKILLDDVRKIEIPRKYMERFAAEMARQKNIIREG